MCSFFSCSFLGGGDRSFIFVVFVLKLCVFLCQVFFVLFFFLFLGGARSFIFIICFSFFVVLLFCTLFFVVCVCVCVLSV